MAKRLRVGDDLQCQVSVPFSNFVGGGLPFDFVTALREGHLQGISIHILASLLWIFNTTLGDSLVLHITNLHA